MARVFSLGAAMAALAMAFAPSLPAQTDHTADAGDHQGPAAGPVVCGSEVFTSEMGWQALANTERQNPALYRQMVEDAKKPHKRLALSAADDEFLKYFYVLNRESNQFDNINAKLVFNGQWARIWVDLRDTGRVAVMGKIAAIARGLDSTTGAKSRNPRKGIIENDQDVFGMPPVNRFEPSLPTQDFLLTDIRDGLDVGFVGGFFYPWDQGNNPASNQMNLLYIDSREGAAAGTNAMLSTVAHEFQHLIHYRTNPESQSFFNEGCSEVASILLGYQDRNNHNYLADVNIPFLKWNTDDDAKTLIDYSRAMTFHHYMYEQYGEAFLTAFASTTTEGMDRIADALRTVGRDPDWQSLLANFVTANYLGTSFASDLELSYRTKLWSGTRAPAGVHNTFGSDFPASGRMIVQQYGGAYNVYDNPGGIKAKFSASHPIRVMAILYKGASPVEVWQLENNEERLIAQNGSVPYDKVVFAVVNLDYGTQEVNWTVEKMTLGVDDGDAVSGGSLAISGIVPNPAVGTARVSFRNARSGEVRADLYNPKGELVRTLVDGDRYEAGEHEIAVNTSGLASGIYMVRLQQQGEISSSVMVVMNR